MGRIPGRLHRITVVSRYDDANIDVVAEWRGHASFAPSDSDQPVGLWSLQKSADRLNEPEYDPHERFRDYRRLRETGFLEDTGVFLIPDEAVLRIEVTGHGRPPGRRPR